MNLYAIEVTLDDVYYDDEDPTNVKQGVETGGGLMIVASTSKSSAREVRRRSPSELAVGEMTIKMIGKALPEQEEGIVVEYWNKEILDAKRGQLYDAASPSTK